MSTINNQQRLNELIKELASKRTDDELKEYSKYLNEIYSESFHHLYSEFYPIITNIFQNQKDNFNLELLINNLEIIKNLVAGSLKFAPTVVGAISKLCDHINLEVARLNYSQRLEEELKNTRESLKQSQVDLKESEKLLSQIRKELIEAEKFLADAKSQLTDAKAESDSVKNQLVEANSRLENSQSQLVTVLGIFATIVLAFAGGLNILAGVISSVSNAPILNLLLVAFAAGLVLIDAITALIYAVSRISGKSIFAKCKNEHCTCTKKTDKGKEVKECCGLTKIRKRLPFIFWINIVLIVSIVVIGTMLLIDYFCPYI